MSNDPRAAPPEEEEGHWCIEDGRAERRPSGQPFRSDGTEDLTYSNPFNLEIERVWFDRKVVYAVELDDKGKLKGEPDRVEGQYNIYDSVPGMPNYSPLWQFNYVVVPRDYEPNTLRSEADCLNSGYQILKSTVVEN
jgi:hypothetical protein